MVRHPIMDIIATAFQYEITNPATLEDGTLIVNLSKQRRVAICAVPIKRAPTKRRRMPVYEQHTYHYVHQHDYDYDESDTPRPATRFTLHNMADCCSYLDDVCRTLLNAQFHDFEITLSDGSKYLLMIEPVKN